VIAQIAQQAPYFSGIMAVIYRQASFTSRRPFADGAQTVLLVKKLVVVFFGYAVSSQCAKIVISLRDVRIALQKFGGSDAFACLAVGAQPTWIAAPGAKLISWSNCLAGTATLIWSEFWVSVQKCFTYLSAVGRRFLAMTRLKTEASARLTFPFDEMVKRYFLADAAIAVNHDGSFGGLAPFFDDDQATKSRAGRWGWYTMSAHYSLLRCGAVLRAAATAPEQFASSVPCGPSVGDEADAGELQGGAVGMKADAAHVHTWQLVERKMSRGGIRYVWSCWCGHEMPVLVGGRVA
jgi:hypothetical protein